MFLARGIKVNMFTSGSDQRGENILEDQNFTFKSIISTRDWFFSNLRKIGRTLKRFIRGKNPVATTIDNTDGNNYYQQIKSETITPPYGRHNCITLITRWTFFLFGLVDNIFVFFYLALFYYKTIKNSEIIVGYEHAYSFASKWIARMFNKKYINKFQGVVSLKACHENISDCKKYYPYSYFGLLSSDLCIMVNDGTNGIFYARERGCKNIYFEPHGVSDSEYSETYDGNINLNKYAGKFIIFNNASNSKLKRVDRVVRPLQYLAPNIREKVVVITTYHAEDIEILKNYARNMGVSDCILFMDRLNHKDSNYILKNSQLSFMTNEVSNLGNPVLESIYYNIPVLTLDDESTKGFLSDGVDGFIIKLDEQYDYNVANVITKLVEDKEYYKRIKDNLKANRSVNNIKTQQEKEFAAISEIL